MNGGSGTFTYKLSGVVGCALQAITSQPWITAQISQNATGGTVTYTVARNTGPNARSGFILVGSTASSDGTFSITQDGTAPPLALPGDRLVVGTMDVSIFRTLLGSLSPPSIANQKFCGVVQLAPGVRVEAYVPTPAELQGNFGAFAGLLTDPFTGPGGYGGSSPFPGGIIPSSRLSNPWAWRISSGTGSNSPGCRPFPYNFVPFSSVFYTTPGIGDSQVMITSFNPNPMVLNSGYFTLTLRGRGFLLSPDMQVNFNGTLLPPSTNTGVQLTVSVPPLASRATSQSYSVSVVSNSRSLKSNVVQIPANSAPGPFIFVENTPNLNPELHVNAFVGNLNDNVGFFSVLSNSTVSIQTSVVQITATSKRWLNVTPVSAIATPSTPADFNINIDARGLSPGTYYALINLAATPTTGAGLTPTAQTPSDNKTIAVTATISGQAVVPAPPALSFSFIRSNGFPPPAKALGLTTLSLTPLANGASHTFTASVASGSNFISIDTPRGNLPGAINVSVNPAGLPNGTFQGQVAVVSDGQQSSLITADVFLTVRDSPNDQFVFPAFELGGPLPGAQSRPLTTPTDQAGFSADLISELNWLQLAPANGQTPATLQFTVDPSAAGLSPGSHVGFVNVTDPDHPNNSFVIQAILPVTAAGPVITSVANAGSEEPFISQNTFVEIKGANLANTTAPWTGAPDFQSGNLPRSLGNVSVTINGRPAYVSYISPGQVNVLAPVDNSGTGTGVVVVTSNGVVSDPFTVPMRPVAPALFLFDFFTHRVAATHADNTPVGPVGAFPGSYPAAPNETIQVWATGFGNTDPPIPDGRLLSAPGILTNPVTVSIDGVNCDIPFAGQVSPGLYQLNVTVPASARTGDLPIKAFIQGAQTVDGVILAVQQ